MYLLILFLKCKLCDWTFTFDQAL